MSYGVMGSCRAAWGLCDVPWCTRHWWHCAERHTAAPIARQLFRRKPSVGRSVGHRRPAVGKARSVCARWSGWALWTRPSRSSRPSSQAHPRTERTSAGPAQLGAGPPSSSHHCHSAAAGGRAGRLTSATDRRTEDMLRTRAGGRAGERLQGAASVGGPRSVALDGAPADAAHAHGATSDGRGARALRALRVRRSRCVGCSKRLPCGKATGE
jgi:hypothetical protein